MFLSTSGIRCLIVEDDPFKIEGIRTHLRSIFQNPIEIIECQALSTAVELIAKYKFDLAILDMSIHSHEPQAGEGSPFPFSTGGLDVLFEFEYSGCDTFCIILTQYPDIDMEDIPIPVENARAEIRERYGIDVAGCIKYLESDNRWKHEMTSILEKL